MKTLLLSLWLLWGVFDGGEYEFAKTRLFDFLRKAGDSVPVMPQPVNDEHDDADDFMWQFFDSFT